MKHLLLFLFIALPFSALTQDTVSQELPRVLLPSDEDTLKSIISMPKEISVQEASKHAHKPAPVSILSEQQEEDLTYAEESAETLTSLFEESRMLPEFFHSRSIFKEKVSDSRITFLTYPRLVNLVKKVTRLYSQHYSNQSQWLYYDQDEDHYKHHIHQSLGCTNNSGLPRLNTAPFSFAQKITRYTGDMLINIGDLHGSYHALLHILAKLYARKLITNDLTLAPKTTLIFNGDLVDRGDYSTEVCYVAYLLKLRNPDQVFILAGNHERYDINTSLGSTAEFNEKFPGKTSPNAPTILQQLYRFLPIVLYVRVINTAQKEKPIVLQYCHGGFAKSFKPMKDFLRFNQSFYYRPAGTTDSNDYSIFHWGDFSYNTTDHCFSCLNRNTNTPQEDTPNVQQFFNDPVDTGVDIIIRGHQETLLATKLPVLPGKGLYNKFISFFQQVPNYATSLINAYKEMLTLSTHVSSNPTYREWAKIWCRTIDSLNLETSQQTQLHDWRDACNNKKAQRFTIQNMAVPIVTCSSATECKFITEAGCLLTHTTGTHINQWSFEPLLIDIISPRKKLFEKTVQTLKKNANKQNLHHGPARLYSITTAHQSGDVTIEYLFKKPTQAFFDNTEEPE